MKKPNRNKSISSISSSTIPTTTTVPILPTSDLELFSSYSHEQVHIYDKFCSSISSICEIAYCTSEGIIICVPSTYKRETSSSQNLSSSLSSMLITRIAYPFQSSDQTSTISLNSSSYLIFEKIKNQYLPRLYESYKRCPTSLSPFDRLLCSDIIQYKGFRRCLFSPIDITLNHGQSILATITCAHEVFIYEIISSSKRFFLSQSSNLKIDLTKYLFENIQLEKYLHDDLDSKNNYRLLYFHLTSNILWNNNGTLFFQLQYSGHIIIWKFDQLNKQILSIIDTEISKPLLMIWNEECQMLLIIGKENQRVFIRIDQMKLFHININENDYMNTEHAVLIKWNETTLVLVENKMNYCVVYSIDMNVNESSTYDCNQIDYRVLPSPIIGCHQQQCLLSTDPISIIIGCEDGTMHSLTISRQPPLTIIDMKLAANGHIKSCSRKPLLLRHFNLSSNELLLARIFYSPIVAPNVKFGFVICTLHRWSSTNAITFDKTIENFLGRSHIPLWKSSDELAIILNEVTRGTTYHYQIKKNTNDNFLYLQRLCRLHSLLNNTKQLQIFENQLLQNYRHRLSEIFNLLFSKMINKLTSIELLIYTICCKDEQLTSSTLLMCPMCNTSLTMTNQDLLSCTCSNKHIWPRCCRTLLPLSLEDAQTCSLCDRTIILIETNDKNYINFVKYKDKELNFLFSSICTYCM
ncbi:unnamed protein product [Adineta steineri]|uniref:Transcription factor IIIC putative zinc-finger domain-containing protein n=1 Tax=Adineta steineri TaxID=433720 RepID=A0A819IZE5_9BILA|nr:unnamed protein product [Adineta steineri]